MKRRLFLSSAVILLISLSYPSYTNAWEFAKSAKGVVNNYIQGYLEKDFKKIIFSDLNLLTHIDHKVKNVPKPFQDEETEKQILKIIEELKKHEQNKLTTGTSLTDFRAMIDRGGNDMYLFNILYPKMKYEILEVRDLSEAEIMLRNDNCKKIAFVRLSYSSPEYAPFLNRPKTKGKIKNVIVKIYLSADENFQEYIIIKYSPTDYKRELFKTAKKKGFNKPTKIIYEFEFKQGGKSKVGYKGKVTNTSIIYTQFPEKKQYNIWFGDIWSISGQTIERRVNKQSRETYLETHIRIGLAFDYYRLYCADRAKLENLIKAIEPAILQWYDKYKKFSVRKKSPSIRNFVPKSTTSLNKTRRQSEEKAQAPVKTEKVLVKEIQKHLMELKYFKSSIDGLYGPKTASAIKSYQRDNNLTPDGKPSSELLAHLEYKKGTPNKPEQTAESKKTKEPQTLEATVNKAVDGFFKAIFKKK